MGLDGTAGTVYMCIVQGQKPGYFVSVASVFYCVGRGVIGL